MLYFLTVGRRKLQTKPRQLYDEMRGGVSYGWIEWLAGREIVNKVIQEGEGNDSERCR